MQGGALLNIRDAFGIGDWAAEAIVGAAKFGAVPGTFLGGAPALSREARRMWQGGLRCMDACHATHSCS